MLKIFCQECGGPTEYTLTRPLFCGRCGHSFSVIASSPIISPKFTRKSIESQDKVVEKKRSKVLERYLKSKNKIETENIEEEIEDDGIEDVTEVPQLESLDVDIIGSPPPSVKLGDILRANTGKTPINIKIKKNKGPKPSKVNKEQVWRDFSKEAGKSERIDIGDIND